MIHTSSSHPILWVVSIDCSISWRFGHSNWQVQSSDVQYDLFFESFNHLTSFFYLASYNYNYETFRSLESSKSKWDSTLSFHAFRPNFISSIIYSLTHSIQRNAMQHSKLTHIPHNPYTSQLWYPRRLIYEYHEGVCVRGGQSIASFFASKLFLLEGFISCPCPLSHWGKGVWGPCVCMCM